MLTEAEYLATVGYTEFVVISADHAFTALAEEFPTTVITRTGQAPAARLRRAAKIVLTA